MKWITRAHANIDRVTCPRLIQPGNGEREMTKSE